MTQKEMATPVVDCNHSFHRQSDMPGLLVLGPLLETTAEDRGAILYANVDLVDDTGSRLFHWEEVHTSHRL